MPGSDAKAATRDSQGLVTRITLCLLNDGSQEHDHLPLGLIRLHDAVRLLDLLEAEHARRLRAVAARLHVGRDRLEGHVRQREARLAEYEAGEEGQVDAARH